MQLRGVPQKAIPACRKCSKRDMEVFVIADHKSEEVQQAFQHLSHLPEATGTVMLPLASFVGGVTGGAC